MLFFEKKIGLNITLIPLEAGGALDFILRVRYFYAVVYSEN